MRVQDVGLAGASDSSVLDWAAREGRVVVTHDLSTLSAHAYERVAAGEAMPGVFVAAPSSSIGRVIEELRLIVECSLEDEWRGQVRYLPL